MVNKQNIQLNLRTVNLNLTNIFLFDSRINIFIKPFIECLRKKNNIQNEFDNLFVPIITSDVIIYMSNIFNYKKDITNNDKYVLSI